MSLVKTYDSIDELLSESTLVVRVQASADQKEVSADSAGTDKLASTLTTVKVLETYVGSPDSSLTIRQSGSKGMVFDGLAELLVPGDEYILFLKPFSFDPKGPDTGEFIITGEVGAYQLQEGRFKLTAKSAPNLPTSVDADNPLGD
ncbi:MAG TPA: hypothetical protein VFV89_12050 [Nocardioides sp.]|uniref:hypothetical protein n=1 Tax=Nocardioides sp. TaxID=35761 RepID=UPI002E32B1E5|nr:hypothetical protein [Nocardioides sp.]HEX5088532.1 hypothetical protein [Nocardioides sp.]